MGLRSSYALVALAVAACGGTAPKHDYRIVVDKSQRSLQLFDQGKPTKTYKVALGRQSVAVKQQEGDFCTPEGDYYICTKNPKSRFHLSLGVSYPGPKDAARGLRDKLITQQEHDAIVKACREGRTPPWKTALGGEVFVHGGGTSSDWTWGCVALDNKDIEELFRVVPVGTPITIKP